MDFIKWLQTVILSITHEHYQPFCGRLGIRQEFGKILIRYGNVRNIRRCSWYKNINEGKCFRAI